MFKIDIEVKFDADKIGDRFAKKVTAFMDDLASATHEAWENEAKHQLFTTRDRYVKALAVRKINDFTRQIYLKNESEEDFLVNAIESGYPPFNIFDAMLRSNRASTQHKLKFFSDCDNVKRKGQSKVNSWYPKPDGGFGRSNPPFIDIPKRTKEVLRPGKCAVPDRNPKFNRASMKSRGKFIHPGFKPIGKGGLDKPLREYAIEHAVNVAQDIFNKVLKDDQ